MNHNDVVEFVEVLKNKVEDPNTQVEDIKKIAVEALHAISEIHDSVEADVDLQRGADISSVEKYILNLEEMSIRMWVKNNQLTININKYSLTILL